MGNVIGYRFELLDKDLNQIGEIHPSKAVTPRLEVNGNNTIKRTLTNLRIDPSEAADIDVLSNRVRPVMITSDGAFNLGVLVFTETPRERWTYGRPLVASLMDQLLSLDQPVVRPFSFKAGTTIFNALRSMLHYAQVPQYTIDESSATVGGKAIAWDVGTKLLQIANDLAAMGGYYSLYFDNEGVLRAREVRGVESGTIRRWPDTSQVAGRLTLRYGIPDGPNSEVQRIVQGQIAESDDLLEAPNRYVVIDNGATETPIYGYWDVPDSAPHSYANRKTLIATTINVQGLRDNVHAAQVARMRGLQDRSTFQWATFAADPNPLHDTFDAVEYFGERWQEQRHSLDLDATAKHIHEIRRVWAGDIE